MKLQNAIHKIAIDGRHNDILVMRNTGTARSYAITPARIKRLSRHPNYYVSASGQLGFGFSASVIRRRQS